MAVVLLAGLLLALNERRPHHPASARAQNAALTRVRPADTPTYRTFYIDYTSGSDANSGTSHESPWKLAPGMRGYAGSYSPMAGDHFIFKGGVTWPNSVFPLEAIGSGTAGNSDYYGVDPTWYSGAGFTQPTFSAGGGEIAGSDAHSGSSPADMFIDLRNVDYVTVEGITFTGWTATNLTTYGECAVIDVDAEGGPGDQNITIDRINVLNFAIDDTSGFNGADCAAVLGYTNPPYAGNSIVENSTFAGNGNTYGTAVSCLGNAENNVISGMVGMIFPCGHGTISGNTLSNCGYPSFPTGASGVHADAIQVNAADGSFYIHDNVIHDTGASGTNECESMLVGNPGETDYIWNNVLYNIEGNSIGLTQNAEPGVSAYVWNNTLAGGRSSSSYCLRAGHQGTWQTVAFKNNLCVTIATSGTQGVDTTGDGASVGANTVEIDHNIVVTPSQATTDGYTTSEPLAYSPANGSVPTVNAGVNLSANCTSIITLCVDTTYATARSPLQRPATGAWDVGAYQYVGSSGAGTAESANLASPPQVASTPGRGASTPGCQGSGCGARQVAIVTTRALVTHGETHVDIICAGGGAATLCRGTLSLSVRQSQRVYRHIHGRWRTITVSRTRLLARAHYVARTGVETLVVLRLDARALNLLVHARRHRLHVRVSATIKGDQTARGTIILELKSPRALT